MRKDYPMKSPSLAVIAALAITILAGCTLNNSRPKSQPISTPAASGNQKLSLVVGSLTREYVVHVPPQYDGNTPLPVVIMFHGGGGNDTQVISATGWDAKADQEGFLAVFPQGTRPDQSQPRKFVGNPSSWNDGSARGIGAVKGNIDDVGFVSAMIQDLEQRYKVDSRHIYATGFSNGASMTFRLARELPYEFAAVAPVSGGDWETDVVPDRTTPVIYFTGLADPLNPFDGGNIFIGAKSFGTKEAVPDMIASWVKLANCQEQGRVIYEQDGAKGVAYCGNGNIGVVELYTIEGHGHFWPGGPTDLPVSVAGKNTAKISATDVIWNFFLQYANEN